MARKNEMIKETKASEQEKYCEEEKKGCPRTLHDTPFRLLVQACRSDLVIAESTQGNVMKEMACQKFA